MIVKASARYIRISTRKTGNVLRLVKGLPVSKAEAVLDVVRKRPALHIKRLLKSAVDSAEKRFKLSAGELYISMAKADQGPTLKRYRAASMGRATMIRHRTTHITIALDRLRLPVSGKDTAARKEEAVSAIKNKMAPGKKPQKSQGE